MREVGNIASFKVAPRVEGEFEKAVHELFGAMAEEEYSTGGVKTFAFYKVPNIFGHWYAFAQFTDEAMARHGRGPKVKAAREKLRSFLVRPAEYQRLQSIIIQGCGERIANSPGRPAGTNPATDVGVIYSFRVNPEDDEVIEPLMRKIFKIIDRAEISTGNVLTYNLYRDASRPGHWVMFEHFTAKGAVNHATDAEIFGPGMEQVNMLPEPFSRVLLNPFIVHGCGERMPSAPE